MRGTGYSNVRICSGPGCLRVVGNDTRYCAECSPYMGTYTGKMTGAQRAEQDAILRQYSLPRWNKGIRPRILQRYPYCVDCGIRASAVVDHDIPARLIVKACKDEGLFPFDPWGGFYIMSNLKGRCHSCHNAKTKTEDTLDWTAQLDVVLAPYRTIHNTIAGGG